MNRIKELDPLRKELAAYCERTAEKMGESAIVLTIFTNNYKEGLDSLLQFAISVMLDKPLFLLAPDDVTIPKKIRQLADGIELYKDGDTASMQAASERLFKQAQEKGFTE